MFFAVVVDLELMMMHTSNRNMVFNNNIVHHNVQEIKKIYLLISVFFLQKFFFLLNQFNDSMFTRIPEKADKFFFFFTLYHHISLLFYPSISFIHSFNQPVRCQVKWKPNQRKKNWKKSPQIICPRLDQILWPFPHSLSLPCTPSIFFSG